MNWRELLRVSIQVWTEHGSSPYSPSVERLAGAAAHLKQRSAPSWQARYSKMTHLLVAVALATLPIPCLGSEGCGSPQADSLPQLKGEDGRKLEPSGLVWDDSRQLAIAVNDERSDGYEVFYFDPSAVQNNNTIQAHPLLTREQSQKLQLEDLEGLTRTDSGRYYAIASLSLDRDPSGAEDSWRRFQGVAFSIKQSPENKLIAFDIERISAKASPNLRKWLISSSGRLWDGQAYQRRAERGGINVEGIASRANGELILGFRGPLDEPYRIPVLFLRDRGPTKPPAAIEWSYIDVGDLPGKTAQKKRGVRAMEGFTKEGGAEAYLIVVGHTGPQRDPLRLGIWEPREKKLEDRGQLPENFVAEGIAFIKRKGNALSVLVVDDAKGRVLCCDIEE